MVNIWRRIVCDKISDLDIFRCNISKTSFLKPTGKDLRKDFSSFRCFSYAM